MIIDPRSGRWETHYSKRGFPYQIWQRLMPWIEPEVLECAVYLYPSEAAAEDGMRIGGSGFVVGVPIAEGNSAMLLCVVTNKHVIDSGNMVVRVNTIDNHKDIIPLDGARWYLHPDGDDLAVCPVQFSSLYKIKCIPLRLFLSKNTISKWEIGPGDDVYVVGRFVNHEGKQRNLPSVRFGNISQMPSEPIVIDGRPQESFLVEARSISGYSGSPVFVYLPPAPMPNLNWTPEGRKLIDEQGIRFSGVSPKRMNIPMQLGPWLLGVDYCHIRWDEPIWSKLTEKPVNDDWFVKSNTGMMGVVPAWKLREIIEGDEMKPIFDELKKTLEEAKEKDTSVELDAAELSKPEPPTKADNPSHKEDFNRLLGEAARKPKQGDQT